MGFLKQPLPFERGAPMCGGDDPPETDAYEGLVGRTFETLDDDTHETITLLVCRNESGGDLTLAKKFYRFGTGEHDLGRNVIGLASAAGQVCKPADPELDGVVVPEHDLFYLVYAGPAEGTTETNTVSLSAHGGVVTDTDGCINGAAPAAGNFVVARIDEACTAVSTEVGIHVNEGWGGGEGA